MIFSVPRQVVVMIMYLLEIWPWGYKTFFMLNSTEHEIFPIVGILTFMSRKNTSLGLSETEKFEFLDIYIHMSI